MNYKKISYTLFLSFLCSCSVTSTKPSETSSKSQGNSKSLPLLPEKAEKVCGDPSPSDPKAYPVSFYSVSVEYSGKNLELIQKHFCEDAIRVNSKLLGKEVVQVASFTSKEKANSFKEKLSQHFSQVRIGEPTIVEKPTIQSDDDGRSSKILPLHKLSGLTQDQFNQINSLRKEVRVDRSGKDFKFRAILPKYIPDGFKLDFFEVRSSPGTINRGGWQGYTLVYVNEQKQCFDLTVDTSQIGGPPEKHEEIKIISEAFGEVTLEYTDFDKGYSNSYVKLGRIPDYLNYQSTKYFFDSPTDDRQKYPKDCKKIDLQIAVKIAENLVVLED
jgi:hypothetical protein